MPREFIGSTPNIVYLTFEDHGLLCDLGLTTAKSWTGGAAPEPKRSLTLGVRRLIALASPDAIRAEAAKHLAAYTERATAHALKLERMWERDRKLAEKEARADWKDGPDPTQIHLRGKGGDK